MIQHRWRRRTGLLAFVVAALIVGVAGVGPARGGVGPENTVVVVNADSWASLAVANEFVHVRQVPTGHVIYLRLNDLPSFERVDVDTFRNRVLGPVLAQIGQRGLAGQIDCIAYSTDIPYTIDCKGDTGAPKSPTLSPVAASTGLTYLYRMVMAKDPRYAAFPNNNYVRRVDTGTPQVRLTPEESKQFVAAMQAIGNKKYADAEEPLNELLKAHADAADLYFLLTRVMGGQGKIEQALSALDAAVAKGFWNVRLLQEADELKEVRRQAEYQAIKERIKPLKIETQDAAAFHSNLAWDDRGRGVADRVEAPAHPQFGYMLSAMLSVTSGRGERVSEAMDHLRRSAAADGSNPKGTVYYAANDDVRSTTREWGFVPAVAKLKAMGVGAAVVRGDVPRGKADVIGAQLGRADPPWAKSESTVLPGALIDNLTSCGGMMGQYEGQTPVTDFLRWGAAGSSGTVEEPYAIQAKFPTPFVQVYYAQGSTLAEAFYQSVAGPYQLLIVGDPLCRPFAKIPTVTVGGIKANETLKGTVKIEPSVTPAEFAVRRYEVFVDGQRKLVKAAGEPISLDTTTLSDGHHEISIVAVGADTVETIGRAVVPVTVGNRGQSASVTVGKNAIGMDEALHVEAKAAGAKRMELKANGLELGATDGQSGQIDVPAGRLGLGRQRIEVVAVFDIGGTSESRVAAAPVEVEVKPAKPLAGAAPAGTLVPGLLVRRGDGATEGYTYNRLDWWISRQAKLKANETISFEGFVDVDKADVYQFQVKSNSPVTIRVDGQEFGPTATGRWEFLPVSLAAGTHRLEVRVQGRGTPDFDVRFGGPGARSLDAGRFRFNPATTQPGR